MTRDKIRVLTYMDVSSKEPLALLSTLSTSHWQRYLQRPRKDKVVWRDRKHIERDDPYLLKAEHISKTYIRIKIVCNPQQRHMEWPSEQPWKHFEWRNRGEEGKARIKKLIVLRATTFRYRCLDRIWVMSFYGPRCNRFLSPT